MDSERRAAHNVTRVGVSDPKLWESIVWKRCNDAWPGGKALVMFGKAVTPRGIETGGLRDDSFVSAVRVLALSEDRIRGMIRSYSHRDAGCIVVRTFKAGMVRVMGSSSCDM